MFFIILLSKKTIRFQYTICYNRHNRSSSYYWRK